MGRPKATCRMSIKGRDGKTHRISLVWNPISRKWYLYRDGKRSARLPEASATQVGKHITTWLQGQQE